MPLKSYLIAPFGLGLQNNVEPWILPENAFYMLTNAYVWRGRVKKRFGTYYLSADRDELKSRFRINLGNTDGLGNISTTVPGAVFAVGQMFSIGTEIFTVNAAATPANMLPTGSATLATYNTTTGALVINGAAATTAVYFYPATPVMGLRLRETSNINFEDTVGFDTQFAYRRVADAWERLGTAVWTGSNSDFHWTVNYRGENPYETALYVVNGIPADNIKYVPATTNTWVTLRPQLNTAGNRFLETAKILIGFKDRLIALNTIEDEMGSDRVYQNRARFSQNGDPTEAGATTPGGWYDDTPGRGGYIDPSTDEAIITAELLKDRLIVYFERSTWELVYTGDATLPFRWQQLNSELGAESRFSVVGFDKDAVAVGNVGIHSCNGINVSRIDQLIPDEVFSIHNGNDGPQRVYGVRDYYRELVYWTFPDDDSNPTFPTRVLVWNYNNLTWAFNEDSFTCFGYYQKDSDLTWADVADETWADLSEETWGSPANQSRFPFICAGNQQGFTFIVDTESASNEQSLYITDMNVGTQQITIINHNLSTGSYIYFEDLQGTTFIPAVPYDVYQVTLVIDSNTIQVDGTFTGTYLGGGKVSRVSNYDIQSKEWNPGTPIGQQFRLPYLDFLLDTTTSGEVSVDYMTDFTSEWTIQSQASPGVILGTNTLYTRPEQSYQSSQVRIWHRYYIQTQGQTIKIKIFMTDDQMRDLAISQSGFEMNAIILYVEPSGRIVG